MLCLYDDQTGLSLCDDRALYPLVRLSDYSVHI